MTGLPETYFVQCVPSANVFGGNPCPWFLLLGRLSQVIPVATLVFGLLNRRSAIEAVIDGTYPWPDDMQPLTTEF